MSKLTILSSTKIIKVLTKAGFSYAPKQGKGSHTALFKVTSGKKLLTIVPHRKEVPRGTLLAILQQAGLTKTEFIDLLDK